MTVSGLGFRKFTPAAVVFLAVLALVLAFCARAVRAEVPNLVSYGEFKAEGATVAVDSATGDAYVAGFAKFCENPETEKTTVCGFGGRLSQFDESGGPIALVGPQGFYTGAAVNPVNKDVYVLTGFGNIEEYVPASGERVAKFKVPTSPSLFLGLTIVQIATDSAGNVYIPVTPSNEVVEYSETGTLLKTFTGVGNDELKGPTGVAVDALGNLWVANNGDGRILELDSSGAPVEVGGQPVEIKIEGPTSVALDTDGNVFALAYNSSSLCSQKQPPCLHLVEFSSTGAQLADVGAGTLEAGGSSIEPPNGLDGQVAVNSSTGRAYVSDLSRQAVFMFGQPKAPEAGKEQTADVTPTGADLGALLNAGGLPANYRFEYGTSTDYGSVAPAVEGEATGTTPRAVWATITGLTPGATYHFRIVAHNAVGSTVGEDQTFTVPLAQGLCPNEEFRIGFSSTLPDCRAYEMVTPPNKDSAEPDSTKGHGIQIKGGWAIPGGGFTSNHAARDGNRFAFWALEVMPQVQSSGMEYLTTRGTNGWSAAKSLIPLQSYDNNFCTEIMVGDAMQAFSSQLTSGVVLVGASSNTGTSKNYGNFAGGCNAEGMEVVTGEPLNVANLLMRDNLTDGFQLINKPPAKSVPTDAHFEGGSSDLSRIFFKENTPLTENGPPGREALYESGEGTLRLVSELPDGEAVAGSLAANWKRYPSVVSTDGSRVFFTAEGNLYERIDGEQTVQLDAPQGGSGAGGGGRFLAAAADGTQVYFADGDSAGLTADTVPGSGANLYRYADGQLTDVTAAAQAEVTKVLGVGAEGVYFVAQGALTGSQTNQHGETATAGRENIYELQGGSITYVATPEGDFEGRTKAVVSPNAAYLAFASPKSLTGYASAGASEIYLYSSASRELSCVSCDPIGAAPVAGGATVLGISAQDVSEEPVGEGVPHQLTDDGRVFFQTAEGLLPTDTNGEMDVYEYEGGQLHLISSGTANSAAQLLDVSEAGRDVFFLSRQPLVPQDVGGEGETNIIYDARELGGFPYVASPPACTTADACRAPVSPQPSIYGAPSSQTFSGAGNLAPSKALKPASKKAHEPPAAAQKRKIAACRRRFRHNSSKRNACIRQAKRARANKSNRGGK